MRVDSMTGLSIDQFEYVYEKLAVLLPDWEQTGGRPRSVSLRDALLCTVAYQKNNVSQEFLAAMFDVTQPAMSGYIRTITPLIADVLEEEFVPQDPAEVTQGRIALVDGTLLPCWSWESNPRLYSGKHKTTGHNHQVITNTNGDVLWISDPLDGCVHDAKAFKETGLVEKLDLNNTVADKGYIGLGITTPKRKPRNGELTMSDKDLNRDINSMRCAAERGIAHLKTWRIFHIDYRRPLHTYKETFRAVRALFFLQTTFL